MKITQLRPEEEIQKLLASLRPFSLESAVIPQRQHLTKDGRVIDVEITASQFYYKGQPSVLVQAIDISERKKMEEKLQLVALLHERNRIAQEIYYSLTKRNPGTSLFGTHDRYGLTERECGVLGLLVSGQSNKEIASHLHVSEGTVKVHMNHILRKLKASSRTEAVAIAIREGLAHSPFLT